MRIIPSLVPLPLPVSLPVAVSVVLVVEGILRVVVVAPFRPERQVRSGELEVWVRVRVVGVELVACE